MTDDFYQKFQPEDIPVPGAKTAQLIQFCSQIDVDIDKFSEHISTHPALMVRVLQVSNSPLYGFQQEIKSISHAIVSIGL